MLYINLYRLVQKLEISDRLTIGFLGTLESEMKKEHRFILMTVFDENRSWYIDENIETFAPTLEDSDKDEDFEESNLMHSE